jgi:hypothetical protein
MLDDLRDEADFVEENGEPKEENHDVNTKRRSQTYFLGMTPVQRFVVAVMILLMVCILGSFFLLVSGTVALPL